MRFVEGDFRDDLTDKHDDVQELIESRKGGERLPFHGRPTTCKDCSRVLRRLRGEKARGICEDCASR